MRKLLVITMVALLLAGCGTTEVFERVEDSPNVPAMAQEKQVVLTLPDDAAAPVVNADGGRLFLCDGYDLTVQTLPGGDISRTVTALCGFNPEQVRMVQTQRQGNKCYEWVWSAAGEGGDQVGRAMVISDGTYHYCVCVMADAVTAGVLDGQWSAIFEGITLA